MIVDLSKIKKAQYDIIHKYFFIKFSFLVNLFLEVKTK
jgi:hypothetical protein